MTPKTIRLVGASRVSSFVLPFFFNRSIALSAKARQRALRYADEATARVRAYYRRSDYPQHHSGAFGQWEISPSTLTAYAFFLRGIARGRVFRYGAIFHSVGLAAASLKHVEVLQWLIREGIPLDQLHVDEDTVLSIAIRYHHEDLARALVDAFPRFVTGELAYSAVLTGIFSGSITLFFELVEQGFPLSFHAGFNGWFGSPLGAAVRRKRHTVTRYLLKHAFTEQNIIMPKDFEFCSSDDYWVWNLFEDAIDAQNREVLEHLKRAGWDPPARMTKCFCNRMRLQDNLRRLKFAESVYPQLSFREYITSIRMDDDYETERVNNEVLRYYHLPRNGRTRNPKVRDWRYDEPTSLYSLGDCLAERPEAILRLLPKCRNLLRKYYKKRKFPMFNGRQPSTYALCLAQWSDTPLFTQQELQKLVDKYDDFHYYAFREHAAELGVEIPKSKRDDDDDECWRVAELQGAELQAFLDQSDEVLANYHEFYSIPMVRFVAEVSTVEALEMWMERGFPICACEDNESWHPTHYANPEILEYYLSEVGMHYRTRAYMEGDTLAWAICVDDVECVKVILKHGYPLNTRKCNDDYPLTYAFLQGSENVARVLYEAGAKMLDRKGHVMQLPSWFKPQKD